MSRRVSWLFVRFLAIVQGAKRCVKMTRSTESTVECNCMAQCADDGMEMSGGSGNAVHSNLVRGNGHDGIVLSDGAKYNTIMGDVIEFNVDDGGDLRADKDVVSENLVQPTGPMGSI